MKQKIVYENGIAFLPGAKAVATSYKKTEDAATEKVVIPKDTARIHGHPGVTTICFLRMCSLTWKRIR